MENCEVLTVAVEIFRKLRSPVLHSRNIEGFVDEVGFDEAVADLEEAGLIIASNQDTRKIEFSAPSKNDAFFAKNLCELIESPDRQLNIPRCFFIAEDDFHYKRDQVDIPEKLKHYFEISRFANILISLSDYHEKKGNFKAIFLHGEKIELNLKFDAADLKELASLNEFIDKFVESDLHKEQKAIIIKSVLLEMLKSFEINQLTLPSLVDRFSDFHERVRANYTLYVSEFSFEKIREQVEKEVFDFSVKLNKVFSDIQNQLLAIPAALILAGTQMQAGSVNMWRNLSVFAAVIVFSLFVSLLIRNQTNTLKAIKRECDSQWNSIKSKHKNVQPLLEKHYSILRIRYISQRIKLFVVEIILSMSILGTMWLLFSYLGKIDEMWASLKTGLWFGIGYLTLDICLPYAFKLSYRFFRITK